MSETNENSLEFLDSNQNPNFNPDKVATVENPHLSKKEPGPSLKERTQNLSQKFTRDKDPVEQIRERESKLLSQSGKQSSEVSLNERVDQGIIREIRDNTNLTLEQRRALYDQLSPEAKRFIPAPTESKQNTNAPKFVEDQKTNDVFWENEKNRNRPAVSKPLVIETAPILKGVATELKKEDQKRKVGSSVSNFFSFIRSRLSREQERPSHYDDEVIYQPVEVRLQLAREYIQTLPSGIDASAEKYIRSHFGQDVLLNMRGVEEIKKPA